MIREEYRPKAIFPYLTFALEPHSHGLFSLHRSLILLIFKTVDYVYEIHHNGIIDLFRKIIGLKSVFCQLISC